MSYSNNLKVKNHDRNYYIENLKNSFDKLYQKHTENVTTISTKKPDPSNNAKENKTKKIQTDKTQNEAIENRFSVTRLLEKNENELSHKKNFFVISNELKEDNEDISWKIKRETLLNKLMSDKLIVYDHPFNQDFHDKVCNEIFLGLSLESRKFINGGADDVEYKQIHEMIEYNQEYFNSKNNVTNQTIMNLCSGFIKLKDIFPDSHNDGASNEDESIIKEHLTDIAVEDDIQAINNETFNEIKKEATIVVTPVQKEDEEFNEEDLDIINNYIESNPSSPLVATLNQLKDYFKTNNLNGKTLGHSNKEKNEMIKELKKEYLKLISDNQEQVKSKKNDESSKKKKKRKEKSKTKLSNASNSIQVQQNPFIHDALI